MSEDAHRKEEMERKRAARREKKQKPSMKVSGRGMKRFGLTKKS